MENLNAESEKEVTITLEDVEDRAKKCGFGRHRQRSQLRDEVQLFLRYFAGLGFNMYSDEEKLRHLVILKPITFLIPAATKIICDYGVHKADEHKTAERRYPDEWEELQNIPPSPCKNFNANAACWAA